MVEKRESSLSCRPFFIGEVMLLEVSMSAVGSIGESSVVGRIGSGVIRIELSAVLNGFVEDSELSPTATSSYWRVSTLIVPELRSAIGNTGVGRVSVVGCAGVLLVGVNGGANVVGLCGFVLPGGGRVVIVVGL